jgi:HD-GYP domain-containing protein (c-di-GMP phosphodiesterase class II)
VKGHAALGAEIVSGILPDDQVAWVRHHHERWDGTGYPEGLRGTTIPDGARILALADAFDVMTTERPYSSAMSDDDALAECRATAGRQFAPGAVAALERLAAAGLLGRGL